MKKNLFFFFISGPFFIMGQTSAGRGVVKPPVSHKPGKTYAVVIGISRYKEVPSLQFADRDAAIFADFLLSKSGMGLDSGNVKLFVNEGATINNIGNSLSDIMLKELNTGDKVIFFFAGHGDYDATILKDQALLLLYGAPSKNYFQNIFSGDFISTADLNARFIEPVSKKGCEVMLFIDACHATGMNKNLSGGEEGGRVTGLALQNMGSAVKFYSCQASQYSLESTQWGGGRGLFSYVLMEGLYGMADADNDKRVTLRELQRYLEDNIPRMAAPNKQDPVVKAEDATEGISEVNDEFLGSYKKNKNKSLPFLAKASPKGNYHGAPNSDSALLRLYAACDSLIELNDLDQAYKTFLRIASIDSTSTPSLQIRRDLSAALQQKTAGILTPLLEDVSKYNASGKIVIQARDDLEKAAALLGEAHFLYKNLQARILYLDALILRLYDPGAQHDPATPDKIISLLEKSVSLEPGAPYTYFELGFSYEHKREYEKATSYYSKYTGLVPRSAWAYNNLGNIYEQTKNYDKAMQYEKRALELDSGMAIIYNNLGNLYNDLKKYPEALRYYKRAIELDSGFGVAYNNLGNLYKDLKNYPDAFTCFKKAVALGPYRAIYNCSLGALYLEVQRVEEAKSCFKKAIAIDPHLPNAYDDLAFAYYMENNFSDAIAIDKKAIAVDPDYENGYYNLSCLYSKINKTDSGLFYMQAALQKGLRDLNMIEGEPDLNSIRTLANFSNMMDHYFTKDEIAKHPKLFATEKK